MSKRFRMRGLALACAATLALSFGDGALALTADEVNRAGAPTQSRKKSVRPTAPIAKAQVLLARQGISPGEIDGIDGENYRKAVAQFRRREKLGEGDTVDAATWRALGGDTAQDIVTEYALTKADASHAFSKRIPRDYARQARMRRLAYRTAPEMHAEHFKMGERLLRALNPRAHYRKAGETLVVVSAGRVRPPADLQLIEADKRSGMVTAYGAAGEMLASYPATIGSGDAPSPSPEGEYQVERIVKNPTYHYDPDKNFQQGNNDRRLVLPRGPNNPVGTVWIGLSKPTFGIHGTPEPSLVSKTSSHGCVRLTNWDAEDLAAMVKPGVTVRFVD